jgi:hypothetical protein
LLDAAFDAVDFFAPLVELTVELPAEADRFVFGLDGSITSSGFSFLQDTVSLSLSLTDLSVGTTFQVPPGHKESSNGDEHALEDAEYDGLVVHRHP